MMHLSRNPARREALKKEVSRQNLPAAVSPSAPLPQRRPAAWGRQKR